MPTAPDPSHCRPGRSARAPRRGTLPWVRGDRPIDLRHVETPTFLGAARAAAETRSGSARSASSPKTRSSTAARSPTRRTCRCSTRRPAARPLRRARPRDDGEPRPRDLVPPGRARRRLAAVRAGEPRGRRRARLRARDDLHPLGRAGGVGRTGRPDAPDRPARGSLALGSRGAEDRRVTVECRVDALGLGERAVEDRSAGRPPACRAARAASPSPSPRVSRMSWTDPTRTRSPRCHPPRSGRPARSRSRPWRRDSPAPALGRRAPSSADRAASSSTKTPSFVRVEGDEHELGRRRQRSRTARSAPRWKVANRPRRPAQSRRRSPRPRPRADRRRRSSPREGAVARVQRHLAHGFPSGEISTRARRPGRAASGRPRRSA